MENYLIERDTLSKVVDELIAEKFPNQSPSELESLREENIKKLDDKISRAIFYSLDEAQQDEINSMFDREEDDPSAFRNFFQNAGVDVEEVITNAITEFGQEFLGGENA